MRYLKTLAKMFVLVAVLTGVFMIIPDNKASANHIGIPGYMPDWARGYLNDVCGHSGQSPAIISWISVADWPMVTTLDVDYGTPSIRLQYNQAAIVCYNNSLGTDELREHIVNAWPVSPTNATISGLVGHTLVNGWGGGSHRYTGEFRQTSVPFTYTPAGGFRNSGWYTLMVDGRSMNHFAGGAYACSAAGGGFRSGWDYASCPAQPQPFSVYINVRPRPTDAGSCSMNISSGAVYPGTNYQVNFGATNAGSGGGFAWPVNSTHPNRYRLRSIGAPVASLPDTFEIRGSGVRSTPFGPILYPPGSGNPNSTTWTSSTFAAPTALGVYTLRYQIYGYNNLDGYHTVGPICQTTLNVVERPYHKVYGGDVSVGAGQGEGCRIDTDASIWASQINPMRGAGTQLANFALGFILDYSSQQNRPGFGQKNLAFANASPQADGTHSTAGLYTAFGGGLHTSNATCAPDYFADKPDENHASNTLNIIPSTPEGVYSHDGNLTLSTNAGGVGRGKKITVYVDGNVFISGSLAYQPGPGYDDIEDLTSLRVIARGNIYVAPGVSEMNGLFVAQANPASANTTGRFVTCYPDHMPTPAEMNGVCRTQKLTVYGAVVADLIKLTRSSGSLHRSSATERYDTPAVGDPAERFIYTPEVWLTSDLEVGGGEFDSYRTLPPVL